MMRLILVYIRRIQGIFKAYLRVSSYLYYAILIEERNMYGRKWIYMRLIYVKHNQRT